MSDKTKPTDLNGGPSVESFIEYGVVYDRHRAVSRSTWSADAGEVAREFRRVARYAEENPDHGSVSVAQRTVEYKTGAWELTNVEALDAADERNRLVVSDV